MKNYFYKSTHTHNPMLLWFMLLMVIPACEKSTNADHEKQMDTWIDKLDRESRKMGIKRSVQTFDSLMATLEEVGLGDKMRYYKFMKVLAHRDSTLSGQALMYTDSLLQLFPTVQIRKKYPIEYSKALLLKGDDFFKQKQYYQAYRNYYHGKSFLTGMGEICECARYSSRIANISFQEENYHQAIEYWKHELKELSHCTQSGNFQLEFIEMQGSLRNIGIAHLLRNEPDIALRYFREAKEFIDKHAADFPREKNFIKFARIVILRNQAEAYALKGDTKMAEKLIARCLQHDPDIEWSYEVEQESRQILANIYIDTRQFTKAWEQLLILKKMAAASKNTAHVASYQKMQANILFGQGKFEEAGKLLISSLEADRIEKLRKNAANKSDVGQLLQQIQLERERELVAEKDARESLLLKSAILLLIALSIIAYLIWRNARKSMINLKAVTALNKVITQSNIVLQDTVNALEQAEIENEHVLKIVAHDLRNPLAAIISASHMLFWDETPSEEQGELISGIQLSAGKANTLISQILESTSDRERIVKNDVSLQEIVQSCIDMLSHKASEKQQKLQYRYESVTVPVDREKIWRVFCNLLSNAIKFSQPGGSVRINLQRQNDTVLLSIEDNGIGIPENLKDQIFLPLNNAKRSGTAGEQSYGIGLSICKQIVESHGGRIWFESVNDAGTTFFVELPV
ncbi:HAMP domain-containing histidine kinase [Dyadobacter chenwenxiniae]|uniref:histidine kinase n=1 Tax=Dyadobacter chenwenxiniae TaxID=2906456 RepID=A0A9X1PT35_9BACT|nr:HAMP domain-containing sensor histidine kinase [Dyadobacter chenwenxiniae]MCF0065163.1 HAMP domain-containing histidine kinase [Dyadobacter chenwenxiniae]UON84566.1 HAMP domain-containing histidine kinase [Dyadobacter chenwenxiniae]